MAEQARDQVPAGDCEDGNGHVHFPREQVVEHESEIQIVENDGQYDVHLGFLQCRHLYRITFCIKDSLNEDILSDRVNANLKLDSYKPTEDGEGHELVVLYNAHKEGLLNEFITVKDKKDESKKIKLNFHSRVLGKGQGTPALRNGIHLCSVDWDEDSDVSDWQGF